MEVARWWAGCRPKPPPIHRLSDALIETLQLNGAPPDVLAKAQAKAAAQAPAADPAADTHCRVWPENVRTVQAFLGVSRYWVYAGMNAVRTQLDWPAVDSYLAAHHPRRRHRQIKRGLFVMEGAVLLADSEQRDTQATE